MGMSPFEEGRALAARGEVDPAIQKLSEALNGDFFHDETLFMLGGLLLAKGMNGLGAVITSAAIDARATKGKPFPEALLNLGGAYRAERKHDIARKVWEDALRHETVPSEISKILTNMAGLYINEGCPEKAIPICDEAIRIDPSNAKARVQRGMGCLELGRWAEGWDGWRHTHISGDRPLRNYPGIPEWDGAPDKTVIVWGDQGLGDELFFAACLKDMERFSKRVILDCHPRLDKLLQRSFPNLEVHGTRKDLTALSWLEGCDADASVALADLPYFFRKNGEWDGAPYLIADTGARPKVRRIGLSWAGGSKQTKADYRSVPLLALRPVIEAVPEAEWYSLQYTENGPLANAAKEVCEFEEKTGIRIAHYPGQVECYDYDRTASFAASLDLIVTVCTTVHHLGGALGVPTWTLVPSRPSWRYGIKGETLPWYGSARLFRQETDGDWSGPIERIAAELRRAD